MTPEEYLKQYGNPDTYLSDLNRLQNGEPVQYIVGNVDFYGFELEVNPNVLIPRFETEQMVEKIIEKCKFKSSSLKIVDLGTGSGCIAITLQKKLNCKVDAVDISKEALEVAKKNAIKNEANITFYQGDFLEPLTETYDVIVSNPPYIDPEEEIMELVRKNEPYLALFASNHGLSCYQKIISQAKHYLNSGGFLIFEIGYQQGDLLKIYAEKYFPKAKIIVEKDLQKKDRYLWIIT